LLIATLTKGYEMKKLLATTAMCLVMATGFNGIASANETAMNITYDAIQFAQSSSEKATLVPEMCFYRGDFQKFARTVTINDLYTGMGSSLMVSVKALRC
jgi:hypothetical protein